MQTRRRTSSRSRKAGKRYDGEEWVSGDEEAEKLEEKAEEEENEEEEEEEEEKEEEEEDSEDSLHISEDDADDMEGDKDDGRRNKHRGKRGRVMTRNTPRKRRRSVDDDDEEYREDGMDVASAQEGSDRDEDGDHTEGSTGPIRRSKRLSQQQKHNIVVRQSRSRTESRTAGKGKVKQETPETTEGGNKKVDREGAEALLNLAEVMLAAGTDRVEAKAEPSSPKALSPKDIKVESRISVFKPVKPGTYSTKARQRECEKSSSKPSGTIDINPDPLHHLTSDSALGQPRQRMYKRCATHVAAAYYIFYQQRQKLLEDLAANPNSQSMVQICLDPTYQARTLRGKSGPSDVPTTKEKPRSQILKPTQSSSPHPNSKTASAKPDVKQELRHNNLSAHQDAAMASRNVRHPPKPEHSKEAQAKTFVPAAVQQANSQAQAQALAAQNLAAILSLPPQMQAQLAQQIQTQLLMQAGQAPPGQVALLPALPQLLPGTLTHVPPPQQNSKQTAQQPPQAYQQTQQRSVPPQVAVAYIPSQPSGSGTPGGQQRTPSATNNSGNQSGSNAPALRPYPVSATPIKAAPSTLASSPKASNANGSANGLSPIAPSPKKPAPSVTMAPKKSLPSNRSTQSHHVAAKPTETTQVKPSIASSATSSHQQHQQLAQQQIQQALLQQQLLPPQLAVPGMQQISPLLLQQQIYLQQQMINQLALQQKPPADTKHGANSKQRLTSPAPTSSTTSDASKARQNQFTFTVSPTSSASTRTSDNPASEERKRDQTGSGSRAAPRAAENTNDKQVKVLPSSAPQQSFAAVAPRPAASTSSSQQSHRPLAPLIKPAVTSFTASPAATTQSSGVGLPFPSLLSNARGLPPLALPIGSNVPSQGLGMRLPSISAAPSSPPEQQISLPPLRMRDSPPPGSSSSASVMLPSFSATASFAEGTPRPVGSIRLPSLLG